MIDWEDAVGAGWSRQFSADELEEEVLSPPSLWEAEVAALSDEHLTALEEATEDS